MTAFYKDPDVDKRTFGKRLGIMALNLVLPGLGLLRLNRKRLAATFIAGQLLVAGLLNLRLANGPVLTFASWTVIITASITASAVLYGASSVLSWCGSQAIEARSGWIWRWYGLVLVWLIAVGLAAPLDDFRKYYKTYYIPSESMLPIMRVNDILLAQMNFSTPIQRGDVVIVRKAGVDYVKRIVAIPGDHVSMVTGQIVLNRRAVSQRKTGVTSVTYDGGIRSATVYEEQLPGETKPHQIIDIRPTPQDNWIGVALGPKEYVMLGDNRDNALDSRFPDIGGGLGIVARQQIVGRVLFRYWRTGIGFANGAV